jgi:hypothetical protein
MTAPNDEGRLAERLFSSKLILTSQRLCSAISSTPSACCGVNTTSGQQRLTSPCPPSDPKHNSRLRRVFFFWISLPTPKPTLSHHMMPSPSPFEPPQHSLNNHLPCQSDAGDMHHPRPCPWTTTHHRISAASNPAVMGLRLVIGTDDFQSGISARAPHPLPETGTGSSFCCQEGTYTCFPCYQQWSRSDQNWEASCFDIE